MKQRRTAKVILAAVLAFVFAFATVGPAFAAQTPNNNPEPPGAIVSDTEGEDVKASITKVLRTGETTVTPNNATFTFTFTQVKNVNRDAAGNRLNGLVTDNVNIPNVTARLTSAMTGTADTTNRVKTVETQTKNFLEGFIDNVKRAGGKAGVYVYDVKENQTMTGYTLRNTPLIKESMKFSKAEYRIYIYVANYKNANGQNDLYIKAIGTLYTKDNNGNTDNSEDENVGKKVNPTPKEPGDPQGKVDVDNSEMKFVNDFVRTQSLIPPPPPPGDDPIKAPLAIKKVVTGEYSDMTQAFNFSVTLKKPLVSDATEFVGTVFNEDGTEDRQETFTLGSNGEVTQTVALKHGQTLSFFDTPVGTHFQASETLPTGGNWDNPTTVVKVNNATVTQGVTATNSGERIVGENPENSVVITNKAKGNIIETGIRLLQSPFFIMIGVAVVAIVALAVIKAKKNAADAK